MQPEVHSNERAGNGAHPSLTRERVTVSTQHPVLAALDAVAQAGQRLAGARRQLDMARAELDEAEHGYQQAQRDAREAATAYRHQASEPEVLS